MCIPIESFLMRVSLYFDEILSTLMAINYMFKILDMDVLIKVLLDRGVEKGNP